MSASKTPHIEYSNGKSCYNFFMLTISADEMQKDVAAYLRLVRGGETVVITQDDKPVAEMKAFAPADELRPFGLCKGDFIVPDDFDAPLPADVTASFEGR